MKRVVMILALAASAASPAAAQWFGMPAWNSPKGGTGITVSGDYGKPNTDALSGNAFGARGSIGFGNLTATVGVASWKPKGASSSTTSYGVQGAFRAIGGSLIPVSINLQVGVGRASVSGTDLTNILAGVGVAASIPTPGLSIEPYLSVSSRWHKISGVPGTESNIGWVIGANAGFGMFGVHIAYDSEKMDDGSTAGIIGIGAHVALKVPMGM